MNLNYKAEQAIHASVILNCEEQFDIDTNIQNLSSRKLWQILNLSQIKGCELEQAFLEMVKQELRLRNDYDDGNAWAEPH